MYSAFSNIQAPVPDPIFETTLKFQADQNPNKINLGGGVFRLDPKTSYILPSVAAAHQYLSHNFDQFLDETRFEELENDFIVAAESYLFGGFYEKISALPTVSCHALFAAFACCKQLGCPGVHLPAQGWPYHELLSNSAASDLPISYYPYLNTDNMSINLQALLSYLQKLPKQSAIILHGCAHNPSGIDFSNEQWDQIVDICIKLQLLPVVDVAYLGFRSADFAKDGYVARKLLQCNIPFIITQFFDKCMAIYGECCSVVYLNQLPQVEQFLRDTVKLTYNFASKHGQAIVRTVFQQFRQQHQQDLENNHKLLLSQRQSLVQKIKECGKNVDFVLQQQGLYACFWMNTTQVSRLREEFSVYLVDGGRASLCGFSIGSIDYVARAIAAVL